jgi:hypothetical protein
VHPLATAGLGFLLAVLWFDLMFDVQLYRYRHEADVAPSVIESISTYYRRVTTDALPMSRLVMVAMLAAIVGLVGQLIDRGGRWFLIAALPTAVIPMALAAVRTVPAAVRLGSRSDPLPRQGELARTIFRDHLVCISMIAVALGLQLYA